MIKSHFLLLNVGIFISSLLLFSCNKDEKGTVYTAGESKRMILTNHQISVEAIYSGKAYEVDSVKLDLDQDGVNDILGLSIIDTVVDESSVYHKELSLKVINNDIVFSEVINSGKKSVVKGDPLFSYEGPFPKKTTIYTTVCGNQPNASPMYFGNSPKYLLENTELYEIDFDWPTTAYNPKINLKTPAYSPMALHYPSANGDSLIGYRFDYTDLCESIPEDISIYLPFLKQDGPNKKYGWLEVKISGNKMTFIQSAIQKR